MRYSPVLTICTSLVVLSVCSARADVEDSARPKLTSAERLVLAEGAAWPAITTLSDGSLGVVYQKARTLEKIQAANVSMQWIRSTDGGKTWSEPVNICEQLGPEEELYAKRPDGGYVVFQYRNQALGQLPSGRIVVSFCRLDYHYDKDGKPDNQPGRGYHHRCQGVFYTWSDDLGKTWTPVQTMDTGPIGGDPTRGISPMWQIVTLADGTSLMAIHGRYNSEYKGEVQVPEGTKTVTGVYRSTDNGETWGDMSVVFTKPGHLVFEETVLCPVSDNRLLAHIRRPNGSMDQYVSTDQGRTWQGPTPFTQAAQQPGSAFPLKSGKLMGTWGNRRPPFGAAAMLSHDGGETWDYEHRVSLAWDAPNGNCGYANGAQAGDGSIVVVYYIMSAPPTDYRRLWNESKAYAVRFTEEQFIEAAGK